MALDDQVLPLTWSTFLPLTWSTFLQVLPLTWSTFLANVSQTYGLGCVFQHSYLSYGENLALGYSSPVQLATLWYTWECNNYNWTTGGYTAGHLTQMLWKATTTVGCAVMNAANGCPSIAAPGSAPYVGANFLVCE